MNRLVIQAKNIHKTYKSSGVENKVLKGISLDVKEGEFIIITGRNGSGKSTLLHQLALLDNFESGSLLVNGLETTHLNEMQKTNLRLNHLGYIFQEYALIQELTALENVILPAMMGEWGKSAKKRGNELLEKVGLHGKSHRLPTQLSGGEQQKVAIARSLINNPHIIFADEPTANLDSVASKEVMGIFKQLNKKDSLTLVMVTHEPEELEYASRHIIVKDGILL
jgi:putative ABC transport system ATP-binding protein